jgi:hypothetical protein
MRISARVRNPARGDSERHTTAAPYPRGGLVRYPSNG